MKGIYSPTTAADLRTQIQIEKAVFQQAILDDEEFIKAQQILKKVRSLEKLLNSFSHQTESEIFITPVID